MPAQQQHHVTSAYLSSGSVAVGQCAVKDASGVGYVVATLANRAAAGRPAAGIALSAGDPNDTAFELQVVGEVPPSITGLGTGAATYIKVSDAGLLVRTDTQDSNTVGRCDTDGTAYVCFPFLGMTFGSGGVSPPGDTSISLTAGDGARVTSVGTAYTIHGVRGTCSLEQFGAQGDGTTDDSAAMTFAINALAAGTYGALVLGAKTYNLGSTGFTVPDGAKIVGQGWKSCLKTTRDGALFRTDNAATIFHLENFYVLGNNTGSSQVAIQCGDGSAGSVPSRGTIKGIFGEGFATYGLVLLFGSSAEGSHAGIVISDCFAKNCANNGFTLYSQYHTLDNCSATGCGYGLYDQYGNNKILGCDFSGNTNGVWIDAGGNDAHGVLAGCTINHNTSAAIKIGTLTNAFEIVGCFIYQGAISVTGTNSLVTFNGCEVAPTSITNTGGRLRFVDCVGISDYLTGGLDSAVSESGNGWTEFVNCRGKDDTVPGWISSRVQRDASFASDADKTLTAQESVAETLIVATGSITASRQITNYFAASTKRKQRVINNTPYDLTYKWAAGTTVTISTGKWADVGSDGTNAIVLANPGASGTGEANTISSSGGSTSLVYGKVGVDLRVKGLTTSLPLVASVASTFVGLTVGGLNSFGSVGQAMRVAAGGASLEWFTPGAPSAGSAGQVNGANGSGGWTASTNVFTGANYISIGATPAGSGLLRLPYNAGDLITVKDSGGTDRYVVNYSGGFLTYGSANIGAYLQGLNNVIISGSTGISFRVNNVEKGALGTEWSFGLPLAGSQTASKALSRKNALIDLTGVTSHTATVAEYACPRLYITRGTATTCEVVLPNDPGVDYIVTVDAAIVGLEVKLTHIASGAGATVSAGQTRIIAFDTLQTKYVLATP